MCQGGFPESWRTAEQDVIDRITPMSGRFDQDTEIFLDLLLANVLIQRRWPQTGFQERFICRLTGSIYQTFYHTTIPTALSAPVLVRRL
jgi:hypothetical protein